MKLEVGMYIKTDNGIIAKIQEFDEEYIFIDNPYKHSYRITILDIIKASHNIIDLIEVGDYVNGDLIENIYKKEDGKLYYECWQNEDETYEVMAMLKEDEIKEILTKELYETNFYRIGGNND